jgi:hypothetical protein
MQSSFVGQTRISKSWLFAPPIHGPWAVALTVVAGLIPVFIRLGMSPQIDDQACTIFCPFVLAISILCGWRWALALAVGTATACNTILMGAPYMFHFQRSEIEGLSTFLGYSVFVVLVIQLFRMTAARSLRQAGAAERASGIVFSLDDGQAWASWYGIDAPVRLGPRDEVVQMMEDFIAQVELGKRLQDSVSAETAMMD